MVDDHVESFIAQFGKGKPFAPPDNDKTAKRLQAERKAGQTAKQRGKKSVAKKQLNIRAADETHVLIEKLADRLDSTKTDVIERAVAELAKSLEVK